MHRTYFWDRVRGTESVVLIAVIIQRETDARSRADDDAPPRGRFPKEWNGTTDMGGPLEACYSRDRGVARAGGREFPLPPDGRTLILLVDHDDRTPDGPRTIMADVAIPLVSGAMRPAELDVIARDPARKDEIGKRHSAWMRETHQEWERRVNAVDAVRAFLDGGTGK